MVPQPGPVSRPRPPPRTPGGEDLPAPAALFAATLGLAGLLTSYPSISSKTPLPGDFVRFALSVIGLVPPIFAAYFACGKIKFEAAVKELMDDGIAILACVIGLVTILAFISEILETKVSFSADFSFGVGIVAAIPGVVTILKFSPINKALDDLGVEILGFLEMVESIAMVYLQMYLLVSFSPALSREAPPRPARMTGARWETGVGHRHDRCHRLATARQPPGPRRPARRPRLTRPFPFRADIPDI